MTAAGQNRWATPPSAETGESHVNEVLTVAHAELKHLLQQRAEIMKRIGTIKQTIAGLANIFGDKILDQELLDLVDRRGTARQPGFTKACRMVLMEAATPLTARDVCGEIQRKMPPVLLRHKDPLASVTTVLNRLAEYGEARSVLRENGRRAWEWVADPSSARLHAVDIEPGQSPTGDQKLSPRSLG